MSWPAQRMMRSGMTVTRVKSFQVPMPTTDPRRTSVLTAAVTPHPLRPKALSRKAASWASKKGMRRALTRYPDTLRMIMHRKKARTRSMGRSRTESMRA